MGVIWTPQPRQKIFMSRKENEGLYGGAAGGGKSDCAIAEALRQVHIPHYRGLILRKTYPQLSELIDRSHEIYKSAFPEAKYNEQKHCWTFESGAKIYFGAMQHTKDRTNYQGKRYDYIDFDELTHFTWDEYSYLFSRNRPNGPGTRCYIRAQANPGGIGHGWVKERFISPAPPMTTIYEDINIIFPDGHSEARRRSRIFVPSSVFDNKILLKNDPEYITRLAALPENEKRALLYGDWDSFSGQVFTEWRNNPDGYSSHINTHVIEPFRVPDFWRIYRGFDFGYSRPFSVGWYAVDTDGRMYRIRELYGCTGVPNEGLRIEPGEIARRIRQIEKEDVNLKNKTITGIADPSIFDESRGESVAAMMEREGVYFEKADNTRLAGKMQVHNRLSFDGNGKAMLYVFSTCKHFIRTIPALVYSQSDVEDIDTQTEDHIYDEVRYVAMAHPISPPENKTAVSVYDPLDINEYAQYGYSIKR
ncbi:MAG: terminase family protein [Clostridia bacterium]|nr:terminase family protein [Clostridia bacterium]